MDKRGRKLGAALRKLRKAQSADATLKLLQEIKRKDPELYKRIQNMKGN